MYTGTEPACLDNSNGTNTDLNAGLIWLQDPGEKMTYTEASAGTDSIFFAGYGDWRLSTVKELYSLIDFTGTEPSGEAGAAQPSGGRKTICEGILRFLLLWECQVRCQLLSL